MAFAAFATSLLQSLRNADQDFGDLGVFVSEASICWPSLGTSVAVGPCCGSPFVSYCGGYLAGHGACCCDAALDCSDIVCG